MKRLALTMLFLCVLISLYAQTKPVMLIVEAESDTICAGMWYNASVRLINTSYSHVKYESYGMILSIDSTGAGIIKFKAGAGAYNSDGLFVAARSYTATYTIDGTEKVIKASKVYVLRRPRLVTNTPDVFFTRSVVII